MSETIKLAASDGHTLTAYLARPSARPRGAIIVVPEIFGVNHHIKAVTDQFAGDGYVAIAPALFDRVDRDIDHSYTHDAVVHGRKIKAQISTEMAMLDLAATRDAVAEAGNVGIVGYCWGGYVTWLAAAYLDGITCAVPYYGAGILEHQELVPRIPVMGHFGERDALIPAIGVKQLAARHASHQFYIYSADHGFNCDERGSYDRAAAHLARERTFVFFRQYVG